MHTKLKTEIDCKISYLEVFACKNSSMRFLARLSRLFPLLRFLLI